MGGAAAAVGEGAAAAAEVGAEAGEVGAEAGEVGAEAGEAGGDAGEAGEAGGDAGEAGGDAGEAGDAGGDAGQGEAAADGGDPIEPPNEQVVDNDPVDAGNIEENEANAEQRVDEANENLDDDEKVKTWKDYLKNIWGVTEKVLSTLASISGIAGFGVMIYMLEKGNDAGAKKQGGKIGLTPEEVLKFNEQLKVWINLSVPQKWERLHNLMVNVKFTPDQEIYLINWLYKLFGPLDAKVPWKWTATEKWDLLKQLKAAPSDAEMYTIMQNYTLNGDVPPFSIGLEQVTIALGMKYPPKNSV